MNFSESSDNSDQEPNYNSANKIPNDLEQSISNDPQLLRSLNKPNKRGYLSNSNRISKDKMDSNNP